MAISKVSKNVNTSVSRNIAYLKVRFSKKASKSWFELISSDFCGLPRQHKITKVFNFFCSPSSSGSYYNQPGFSQDYNNQGYGNQAYGNQQTHDSNYDDYYQQFDGRQSNKRQGYIY